MNSMGDGMHIIQQWCSAKNVSIVSVDIISRWWNSRRIFYELKRYCLEEGRKVTVWAKMGIHKCNMFLMYHITKIDFTEFVIYIQVHGKVRPGREKPTCSEEYLALKAKIKYV